MQTIDRPYAPAGRDGLAQIGPSRFQVRGIRLLEGEEGANPAVQEDAQEFPEGTPVAEMTAEQQVAYWRDKARKHETAWKSRLGDYTPEQVRAAMAENEQLRQSVMSDSEKALDQARMEGELIGAERYQRAAIRGYVEAAYARSGGAASDESRSALDGLIDVIDPAQVLTTDGDIDTDKIDKIIGTLTHADAARHSDGYMDSIIHAQTRPKTAGSVQAYQAEYAKQYNN